MRTLLTICLALLAAAASAAGPSRVLLVINENSPDSRSIGAHYAAKRALPRTNILRIRVPDSERISRTDYHENIRKPLVEHIRRHRLEGVDFIVTTKGVPLVDERGFSVDSMLTRAMTGEDTQMINPYFGQAVPFSRRRFGMFLVTRLDGYTAADAKALVDRALKAPGKRGTILLDLDPFQDTREGYRDVNRDIRDAALRLFERRADYRLDSTDTFVGGMKNLGGYYSWGSNDSHFSREAYLSNRFVYGAIGETVVSTSARTFRPEKGGQSLIADLIRNGITGVKGYVTEPYAVAMARAAILFPRYVDGFNLAESFYAASPFICWKDVVIGDPLCAPYRKASNG
ncbi:MAG: hypothetical protein KatS3mg024_2564 [Armatimonadota bacterium]|nr:MAG: hypothetical protein KatS3mg024_2564 [Armatimonadota bacterium]